MTDFDLEQLKTLFINLSDKLAETKGDVNISNKLKSVEKAIKDLTKKMDGGDKKKTGDVQKIVKSVVSEFDKINKKTSSTPKGKIDLGGINDLKQKTEEIKTRNDSTKSLKTFSDVVKETASSMDNIFSSVISGFSRLDGTLVNTIRSLGIQSKTVEQIAQYVDNRVVGFRELQNASDGSIKSLRNMHDAMRAATMDVKTFSSWMTRGSDGLRILGSQGAANLNKELRDLTLGSGFLGRSPEQLNDLISTFMEYQKLTGNANMFDKSGTEIANGIQDLVLINDKMATILGKNRDDMLKEQEASRRDTNFVTLLEGLGLDTAQSDQAHALMSLISNLGPGAKELFQSVAVQGAPTTQEASNFMAVSGELGRVIFDLATMLRNGNVGDDFSVNASNRIRSAAKNESQYNTSITARDRALYGYLGVSGIQSASEAIIRARTLKDPTGLAGSEVTDKNINTLVNTEETTRRTRAEAESVVNNAFEGLLTQNRKYVDKFTELIGGATKYITELGKYVDSLSGGNGINVLAGGAAGALGVAAYAKYKGTKALVGKGMDLVKGGIKGSPKATTVPKPAGVIPKGMKLPRGAGPAMVALQGLETWGDINLLNMMYDNGEITEEEYKKGVVKAISAGAGGIGGALLLGKLGAVGGGAVGAFAGGIGAVPGAIAGGLGGALVGGIAGNYAGDSIGEMVYENFLANPNTKTQDLSNLGMDLSGATNDLGGASLKDVKSQSGTLLTEITKNNNILNQINETNRLLLNLHRESGAVEKNQLDEIIRLQDTISRNLKGGTL